MAAGQCRSVLIAWHQSGPQRARRSCSSPTICRKCPSRRPGSRELDETAMHCDLVLPLVSPLEDFGTHVASNQSDGTELSIQQP